MCTLSVHQQLRALHMVDCKTIFLVHDWVVKCKAIGPRDKLVRQLFVFVGRMMMGAPLPPTPTHMESPARKNRPAPHKLECDDTRASCSTAASTPTSAATTIKEKGNGKGKKNENEEEDNKQMLWGSSSSMCTLPTNRPLQPLHAVDTTKLYSLLHDWDHQCVGLWSTVTSQFDCSLCL